VLPATSLCPSLATLRSSTVSNSHSTDIDSPLKNKQVQESNLRGTDFAFLIGNYNTSCLLKK